MLKLMQSNIINQSYILVGKNILYKDLMTKLAEAFNKKSPHKPIAKWKLMLVSKIDWLMSLIFRTKRKILKATVHSLYNMSFYDGSKIENELVFTYIPFEETLNRVVECYKIES